MKMSGRMLSFILILLVFIGSFIGSAAAQSLDNQVTAMAQETEGQKLDGPLGTLFGSQRINIHITLEDESQLIIGLITENKVVKKLQAGAIEDPTLKIYTDQQTIADIQTSQNPGLVLKEAFDDERITYKAVGLFNKLKFKTIFVFINIIDNFIDDENGNEDKDKDVVKKKSIQKDNENEETGTGNTENSETEAAINVSVEASAEASTETEPAAETANTVEMSNEGFSVEEITIKVGEKVEWKNVRTGSFKTAMILGTQKCSQVKSQILNFGESYSYTFDKAMTCTIVDGILTTTSMKLTVE